MAQKCVALAKVVLKITLKHSGKRKYSDKMSNIPELKRKKAARNAELEQKAAADAAFAAKVVH